MRLKANISRDRKRFECKSVVSQGKSSWITAKARLLPCHKRHCLRVGQSPHISKTHLPNDSQPARVESRRPAPTGVKTASLSPPYCKLPVVTLAGLPMASPDTRSSTLRFCWRPAELSFEATGRVLPKPLALTEFVVTPSCTK